MEGIGKRIKSKRETLGLQVKDLSAVIGVSPSLISQIEKSKSFPSLITLKKIAGALNTTVGELIGENESHSKNPVVQSEKRKLAKKNGSGTSSYLLSNYDPAKQMEPYIVHFKKGSDSTEIMTSNFPCQEFCFVLQGSFEVVSNKKQYILNEGDAFYFRSNKPHIFTNVHDGDSELIWVVKLH